MIQIGYILENIFEPELTYDRYVEDNKDAIGSSGRLVSQEEFDRLRLEASGASANAQIVIPLATWSPRFHILRARKVFSEMRAAHDKLFNVLDAYLAWANALNAAETQMTVLQDESVAQRAVRQGEAYVKIKQVRSGQHTNTDNARRAAEEVANKYIRDPFRGPAQDHGNQVYYDSVAEVIRYNDILNQKASLEIADLYDEATLHGLAAENSRDSLELVLVGGSINNLRDRQELLGFDFTARMVDAMIDVFQNASEVRDVVSALWGLEKLEELAPDYRTEHPYRIGWYFGIAHALWPLWVSESIDAVAQILFGDYLLTYLDQADSTLAAFERTLQEFDAGAVRTMLHTKLRFKVGTDGVSRATLTVPAAYRFQEVNAIYLKGMTFHPALIEAHIKGVQIVLMKAPGGQVTCEAQLADKDYGDLSFGSDGGLSGDEPIYALEGDCLACSSSGNLPIVLVSKDPTPAEFDADCIMRVVGFNDPS